MNAKVIIKTLLLLITLIFVFSVAQTLAQQRTPLKQVDIGEELFDIAWSLDGRLLAVGSSTGVKIYNSSLEMITNLGGHNGNVTAVAWKPDGSQLVSGGGRADGTIRIWDYDNATGEFSYLTTLMDSPTTLIFLIAWSPDGTKLASLTIPDPIIKRKPYLEGEIWAWNTETWKLLAETETPYSFDEPIRALSWNPSSEYLSVAGIRGAHTINAETFQTISWFQLPYAPKSLAWIDDDRLAFFADYLRIGNVVEDQLVNRIVYPFNIYAIDSDSAGDKIAVNAGDSIKILDIPTGTVLFSVPILPYLLSFEWNIKSEKLAIATNNGIIEIWDVSNLPDPSGTATITPLPTLTSSPSPTPTITPISTVIP